MTFEVKNIEDWDIFVEQILPLLKHKILLLKGDLGAGKTTLSQRLVNKIGSRDVVTSPTYSIVNEYTSPRGTIFHFDLYRVNHIEELFDIGIDEYLEKAYLSIIEWPNIYEKELEGVGVHEISIENKEGIRLVRFTY